MTDTIADIKSGLQSSFVPAEAKSISPTTDPHMMVFDLDRRLEAVLDLMTVLYGLKEQEYNLAFDNAIATKENEGEPFEDFLARRRALLLKMMKDAGLR